MTLNQKPIGPILIVFFIIGIAISNSFFIVTEMDQALLLQFGQAVQTLQTPGLKLKIPFLQDVVKYDRRTLSLSPSAQNAEEVILADQKRLMVDAYLRYRITDPLQFYQRLRNEANAESQLVAFMQSALRSELAKMTQAEILSPKREEVMKNVRARVEDQTKEMGVEIVDIRLRGADLPEQVRENVFNLMKSQRDQEAKLLRAEGDQQAIEIRARADKERVITLAEAEKQAQILRGDGDEAAIKIFAGAFNKDPKFYGFMRSLEAYKKTLATSDTTLVMSPDNAFLKTLQQGGQ